MEHADIDWVETGQNVRFHRAEKRDWSQAELARRAGVTQRLISKIEAGKCKRPSMKVREVLWVLGIEPVRTSDIEPVNAWTIERWELSMIPSWQTFEVRGELWNSLNPYQPQPPQHKCLVNVRIGGIGEATLERDGLKARFVVTFEDPPLVSVEIRQD